MALVPSSFQPGLPANASLWRTVALLLLLAGLTSALIGVMSHLFEQVDRHSEEARGKTARSKKARHTKPTPLVHLKIEPGTHPRTGSSEIADV